MVFDQDLHRNTPDYRLVNDTVKDVLEENSLLVPPIMPLEIAKSYGLDVLFANFPPKISHVMGYLDLSRRSIVVNKRDEPNRQTFTIAHELGHYQLHRSLLEHHPERYSVLERKPLGAQKVPIEQEANAFAAHFLVPRKMLDKYRKIASISELARLFVVSEEVIRWRLIHENWLAAA